MPRFSIVDGSGLVICPFKATPAPTARHVTAASDFSVGMSPPGSGKPTDSLLELSPLPFQGASVHPPAVPGENGAQRKPFVRHGVRAGRFLQIQYDFVDLLARPFPVGAVAPAAWTVRAPYAVRILDAAEFLGRSHGG